MMISTTTTNLLVIKADNTDEWPFVRILEGVDTSIKIPIMDGEIVIEYEGSFREIHTQTKATAAKSIGGISYYSPKEYRENVDRRIACFNRDR